MRITISLTLVVLLLFSCKDKTTETPSKQEKIIPATYLPFQKISLDNLSEFKDVTGNWTIAQSAYVDRNQEQTLSSTEGIGILVNNPAEGKMGNLFSKFEHGDIELELDVMMPKNSNSGIYFQGRYEIQLFDSWGEKEPTYGDMGGIYEGDDKGDVEGFVGVAPKSNVAKSPGLWQHFKIIFHAPKFDDSGKKIKNAEFEEVWLNGVLIHENVEVTGPTRAAAFEDEQEKGPLMIQGDHGPVALKNIRYKFYKDQKVSFANLKMAEYESMGQLMPNFDSLTPIREKPTDSISSRMVDGKRAERILRYTGDLQIPEEGEYLFDFKVNEAGGQLVIDHDTLVNFNGNYYLDSLGVATVKLKKGTVPFTLIYNRHNQWVLGFSLEVEGPSVQKHALNAPKSLDLSSNKPAVNIMVDVEDEPVTQRSFLMHNGVKRTHCISVGTPEGINYAYDLAYGSLLKVWRGDFIDTSPMWHSRGSEQLALPVGFTVSFKGTPEFAILENESSPWPTEITEASNRKQLGYEFDTNRIPVFSSQLGASVIYDKMTPSKSQNSLQRIISVKGDAEVWHKVASGESIEKLADGTFIVNDESFFIDFSSANKLMPIVRAGDGQDELLVKIPTGEQKIEYSIIW
ncbi:DUF1080 domain-containing protein [Aurantibacter crassamenti]|uniref:family 16 glycoside hydrolase n=1 Tax=Aurantibacter crassamenti TaxID=1837375 RepID=UPI001939EB36|nr:family 16 glycoside hydrolase [Aurantibacter crassamenti]MBM1106639.1 DUF1080 domain-containing protein [Aurantibacter crassamenti]